MKIEEMTLLEAVAERARILGFRSLSTADWQRVQLLCIRIEQLMSEVA